MILTLEELHLDVVGFSTSFPAGGQLAEYASKPFVSVAPRQPEHKSALEAQVYMFDTLTKRYGQPIMNEHRMGDKWYAFLWKIDQADVKNEMWAMAVLEYDAAVKVNGGWK